MLAVKTRTEATLDWEVGTISGVVVICKTTGEYSLCTPVLVKVTLEREVCPKAKILYTPVHVRVDSNIGYAYSQLVRSTLRW